MTGRARVFTRERDVIAALKGQEGEPVVEGDVIVLAGRGPLGSGMEETYQVTSFLRYLPAGRGIALVTDARFSGVSTGPCIGHVSPEALEGGPIGKVVDGDLVRIVVDTRNLEASVELVGHGDEAWTAEEAAAVLEERPTNPAIRAGRRPAGRHRALGDACSRSAAACGAAASTTSSPSAPRWPQVRWTRRRRIIDYRAHSAEGGC